LFRDDAYLGGPEDAGPIEAAPGLPTIEPEVAEQISILARLAPSTVAVLLQAETGTGKEVAARAMHALSGRPGPFIAVNCGAIASNLVESELFGYRRGAFSGALED